MPAGGGNQPAEATSAIKYGWEKFLQYWQVILVALIIGFVAMAALGVIGFLIQRSLTSVDDCTVRVSNGVIRSSGCGSSPGFFTTLFASALFQFLFYLGSTILQYFIIRATLIIVRGEKLEASNVMSFDNFGPYFLTAILVGVMTFVGFVLCILPGIAVVFFTMFWGYFVIDKNMKPVEAITASFNLVKENIGAVIIFLLLSWVVTLAGFIALCVGLIVAMPVVTIATGYMYKRLQGEPVAA
jgi:Predicted integral membrane protein